MRKLVFSALIIAFSTTAAIAQDYLKCELEINNNVRCPLLRRCPQKPLRVSKSQLLLEMSDGQVQSGVIEFKRIVLLDNELQPLPSRITFFNTDNTPERIRDNNGVNLTITPSHHNVEYSAQRQGRTISMEFKTENYNANLTVTGNGSYQSYFHARENIVTFKCERLSNAQYQESREIEEAITNYRRRTVNGQQSRASQQ